MSNSPDYDLLIVGGGMVGVSLALGLAGRGIRLGIIEAANPAITSPPSYDDRGIALAYGSRRIFDGLQLWPSIAPLAEPIREIHVSDRGHFGFTRLLAEAERVPALGYVITGRELGGALLGALQARAGVSLIAPARVKGIDMEPRANWLRLETPDGERKLSAKLVVAADGGDSFVRQALNIPVRRWEYGQHAIVTNITPEQPPAGVAFERFTESGPVALLPMREQRCALVWTVRDEELAQSVALNDARFIEQFQRRFGFRLGRFVRVGRRHSYPLSFVRARASIGPRVAVIGNAAHTLHPVAGQGFNLGLRDVAALAEVVTDAHRAGGDVGSPATLAAYERWRSREQRAVALATDGLVRVFSNPLAPVRAARNLSMLALDALPFSKHLLAKSAMGTLGALPKLARGLSLD